LQAVFVESPLSSPDKRANIVINNLWELIHHSFPSRLCHTFCTELHAMCAIRVSQCLNLKRE
jgi:hypothetical protein